MSKVAAAVAYARSGVRAAAASTTTIAAQFVNYTGASGEQRVSSGFPVPPGMVTDAMVAARQIALFVDGTERACNITALRGRHQDGSVRSLEVQCLHTFGDSSETPVPDVELRIGTVRETTDLSYVPLVYARFFDPCVVVATDPDYLCSTWLTMQPLLADADTDATSAAWFVDFFDFLARDPFNIGTGDGLQPGRLNDRDNGVSAHYCHPRGLAARWCRTGDAFYWRWAQKRFTAQNPLEDNTVNPDTLKRGEYWTRIATQASGWSGAASFNPEGIVVATGTSEASEPLRFAAIDFPSLYWMTGYGYLWNSVSNMAMRQASQAASNTYANVALGTYVADSSFGFRFNVTRAALWLAAYVMDATGQTPVGTVYSGGVSRATPTDLRDLLAWCVEAWDRNRWDDSAGAYREGVRGAKITAPDGAKLDAVTNYPAALPLFQVAAANYVLIDLYLNVADYVDPITSETMRHRVRDNLNVAIANCRRLVSGDSNYNTGPAGLDKWGIPYRMTEVPGEDWDNVGYAVKTAYTASPDGAGPLLLPMFARSAAFCAHFFPSDTVEDLDGVPVTYADFYERCINAEQLRNAVTYDILYTWKTFGEYFGFMMDSDYFINVGVPAAPSSARANTDYDGALWSPT